MPTDALIQLQASVTRSANGTFNGTALTLPGGTPRRGMNARVIYSAATSTTTNACQFDVDVSYDGGSTWTSTSYSPSLSLTTTAQSGEVFIPFSISPTSVANGTKIRLTAVVSGAGTPAITYGGEITGSRP